MNTMTWSHQKAQGARFTAHIKIGPEEDEELMRILMNAPEGTMFEAYAEFCARTVQTVHYATVLRAAKRLGCSRQTLRGFAAARDPTRQRPGP